ncbi:MAG: PAS domain S-box protein [Patescibacteria group bacterium]
MDFLKEELEEYKYICNQLPDLLVILDEQGVIRRVSGAVEKLVGYSAKEVEGLPFFKAPFISKEDIPKMVKNFKSRVEGKDIPIYFFKAKAKNGAEVYFEVNGRRIKLSGKNAILLVLRDITKEKELEDKLAEESRKTNKIIDDNPYGIVVLGRDGRLQRANKAFVRFFKELPPKEYSFFKSYTLKNPAFSNAVSDLKKGKSVVLKDVLLNPHKDTGGKKGAGLNKDLYFNLSAFPLMDKNNKLKNVVAMYEDVSARKKAEEQLAERVQELERMNKLMVGRELKMIELKKEIKKLKKKSG